MTSESFPYFWLLILGLLISAGVVAAMRPPTRQASSAAFRLLKIVDLPFVIGPPLLLAAVVLPTAGWGFSDDDVFILRYLEGEPYPPPIWHELGRFFPLAHQEWRLLYPWTRDITLFYLVPILQYACFSLGLLFLLRHLNIASRAGFLAVLTLPPLVVAYSNLIVAERTQVMFLPWLLVFLIQWDRTRLPIYAVLVCVCSHFMLYLKEPTALFLMSLALLRLVNPVWGDGEGFIAGQRTGIRSLLQSRAADLGLLFSGTLFFAAYLSAVSISTPFSSSRVYGGQSPSVSRLLPALSDWAVQEPLLLVVLSIGALTVIDRIRQRKRLGVAEQLFVAAGLYFLALLAAGLVSAFYAALPLTAAAIAVLIVVGRDQSSLRPRLPASAVSVVFSALVFLNLLIAAPRLIYKLDWTMRNNQLSNALGQMVPGDEADRRVFIIGDPWDAEMLAVYANGLRNLGFIFEIDNETYIGNSRAKAMDCTESARSCLVYAKQPADNQLVVHLGNIDKERAAFVYRNGVLLWEYQDDLLVSVFDWTPRPLRPVIRHFYNFW